MGWEGIGTLIGKVSNWIPEKRESMQNEIEKIKKEMLDVQNKKPFDSVKYERLASRLRIVEAKERRAS